MNGNTAPIRRFETLESTNRTAREWAREGAQNGSAVVSETQTMGRGRRGRQWESPRGKGLWMSVILYPKVCPEDFHLITFAAALAASDACRNQGAPVKIKWPNDLILQGKKVCGILCEREGDAAVAGIGLNVSQSPEDFPEDLRKTAASLEMLMKKNFDREKLLEDIQAGLLKYTRMLEEDSLSLWETYTPRCATLGMRVKVQAVNEIYEGTAEGMTPGGELQVRLDDGELKTVTAGDVSVRGVMGYAG